MFEQIIPEFQTVMVVLGTGFGFIVLITTVGEVVYSGAYKAIVRYLRE